MRTSSLFGRHVGSFLQISFFVSLLSGATVRGDELSIVSLRSAGTNLIAEVHVPQGLRKISLESRASAGGAGWTPVAVARLEGAGGQVTFQLSNRRNLELLRARADESEALPSNFYQGTNAFPGVVSSSPGSLFYSRANLGGDFTATPGGGVEDGNTVRTVAESDIWKVSGDRVYFFNVLRGLQVFDIHNPDKPLVQGLLNLPSAGEQMYVVNDEVVVLLIQASCYWGGQQGQVVVVSTKDPQPRILARLPVDGYIAESRMVGSALYVASQTYKTSTAAGQTVYTSGTVLNSFDLAEPEKPVTRSTLWYPGSGSVVTATDRLFFVSMTLPPNWSKSIVHAVDITSPNGEMRDYQTIEVSGLIRDKFKLDYTGSRFVSISEENDGLRRTRLETFFLADPRSAGPVALRKLGDLTLAERESLFATRFDGDKAYIVTFRRVDPLFVVDLTDATHPKVAGEVEVAGFSTFIQPLGDRLVTVGTETNRVAVSLFDVSQPSKPTLLSRVLLGDSYSWSESQYNEKAVTILPSEHLILVPYSGNTTNGYASRVQLIDLEANQLKARGVIERTMQPRRATLANDRIFSISSQELVVVDARDRDLPKLTASLDLSWTVDQIFVQGDYLLQVSDASARWGSELVTQVRATRASDPFEAVATLTLTNWPIAGATLKDGLLYVMQVSGPRFWYRWGPIFSVADGVSQDPSPSDPKGLLTVIDAHDLPNLSIKGQVSSAAPPALWGATWQAVWPSENVLVWFSQGASWGWYFPWMVTDVAIGAQPIAWSPTQPTLLAFDVKDPATPTFASQTSLGTNGWQGTSTATAVHGLVYLSHGEVEVWHSIKSSPIQIEPDLWRQRDFLNVIDFSQPTAPVQRDPVNLPGALLGVDSTGELLYTLGDQIGEKGDRTGVTLLTALAYDGVSAHQIDSVALDSNWLPLVSVSDKTLFLARPVLAADGAMAGGLLESWRVSAQGKWARLGQLPFKTQLQRVVGRDPLLVVLDSANTIHLIDSTSPESLRVTASSSDAGCWYHDVGKGDGSLDHGFWVPLGDYGVVKVGP